MHNKSLTLLGVTLFCSLFAMTVFAGGQGEDMDSSENGQPVEIDFYYPVQVGSSVDQIMQEYATRFEQQHEDIRVNVTYTGNYAQNEQTIQTELSGGGSGPHVSILSPAIVYSMPRDWFVPGQQFIDQEPDAQGFIDSYFDVYMPVADDGQYWSVPFQRSTVAFYYNRDLFEEAGLDPDSPPRNRAQLAEDAAALSEVTSYGFAMPTAFWIYEAFAIAEGDPVFAGNPAEVNIDTETLVDASSFVYGLIEDGTAAPGILSWGDISQDFISGEVAMVLHSTGAMTNHIESSDFNVGFSFAPLGIADGSYGVTAGGANAFVFNRGTDREQSAAWEWVKFLTSPEIQTDWMMQTGYIATNLGAWESIELQEFVESNPSYGVAREQLERFGGEPLAVYQSSDVGAAFQSALEAINSGESAPEEALTRAQSTADSILSQYR